MKKILILMPNNLGDVIMTIPVLEGLRAENTDCHITFFVESGFGAGIENLPYCNEIIEFPRKLIRDNLNADKCKDGIETIQAIINRIANEEFDWIINLCQHEYVSYLAGLMKGKAVSGRYFIKEGTHVITDAWSQYLYAIPYSRKSNNLHAVDIYRRIANVKSHIAGYHINITEKEKLWAGMCLISKGMDIYGKIMVFQPGAAFGSKVWPPGHFISLGNMLVRQGWQILVTGSIHETEMAYDIFKGINSNCFVVTGETSFRQSMALCSMAQGCVTGDTALMHTAAGLGKPVYALFGATNPVETGPYGNGHWVFSANCPERPCFKNQCTSICMKSISPQTVFNCIANSDPGPDPCCDVYRTELIKNGDFMLVPLTRQAFKYWNPSNTYLVRSAFEKYSCEENCDEIAFAEKETIQWLDIVNKMKTKLENYLITKNFMLLKEFELIKMSLSKFGGIGAFWTAIFNIRINAIPLIDPLAGVKKSLDSCDKIIMQISNVVDNRMQSIK